MEREEVKAILMQARKTLDSPDNWTKYAYARDENGEHVGSGSDKACKWCLSGAINKSLMELGHPIHMFSSVYEHLFSLNSEKFAVHFNDDDGTTHHSVIHLLDNAILELETE